MHPADTTGHGNARGDPAFTAAGLCKVYCTGETEVHAFRGVDLVLPAGEILVLLGPSGSGKSTLLNIFGGLDRPTSGSRQYRGTELTGLDDADLSRSRRRSPRHAPLIAALPPDLPRRSVTVPGQRRWPSAGSCRAPHSKRHGRGCRPARPPLVERWAYSRLSLD